MRFGRPPVLTQSRLLVCEGREEVAFVTELRRLHQLPAMDICCIGDRETGNGITGLRAHLIELITDPGFHNVEHAVILADSDHSQNELFGIVAQQITAANQNIDVAGRYAVPNSPFTRGEGTVDVTVLMQPSQNATGCLETLLWEVFLREHAAVAHCIDAAVACSGISAPPNQWSQSKLDKAKVRAGIAMLNEGNPALALSFLWKDKPNIIPGTAPEFDDLVAHLRLI